MRAGDVADGVNHGQNHKAKSERNANVSNGAAGNIVDDDGARPGKDEAECAETLCQELSHFVIFHFCSVQQQPEVAELLSCTNGMSLPQPGNIP